MEILNLAGNAVPNESFALQIEEQKSDTSESHKESLPMIVDDSKEDLCVINTDYHHQLEVADSEDSPVRAAATSGIDDSCASSYQRNSSSPKRQFIQQLSNAIGMVKHLQLLDISDNGFSAEAAEKFYNSWSSSTWRAASGQKHIKEQTIHLSTKENKCCRVKPCCKKD